ncbi:MAG: hypothetical protein WBB52_15245 [Acidimicrobiales bacterium]|jgi:hypothetical protein
MPTSPDPSASFDDATRALYAAFADVAHRPNMARCRHCVTDSDVAALAGAVTTLPAPSISRFLAKAGTTWGDGEDLRRVAPRALHLAADRQLTFGRQVLLEKLANAGWSTWPPAQVDAICRFLLAEWTRLIASPPRPAHCAHGWLSQTATVVSDLTPFLKAWESMLVTQPGPPALHLAVVIVQSDLRPDFPDSVSALFQEPATAEAFGAWLAGSPVSSGLEAASRALATTADARRLTLAVDRLARFRSARTRTV